MSEHTVAIHPRLVLDLAREGSATRKRGFRPRTIETVIRLVSDGFALSFAAGLSSHGARWLFVANVLAVLAAMGSYVPRLSLRVLDDIGTIARALALGLVVPAPLVIGDLLPSAGSVAVAAVALVATRTVVYAVLRQRRATGRLVEPALIVGGGQVAQRMYRLLIAHPEYGLAPVGFADDSDDPLPGPLLGPVHHFEQIIADREITHVLVSYGTYRDHTVVSKLRSFSGHDIDVHVVPRLFDLGLNAPHRNSEMLWDIPLLRLRRRPVTTLRLKRAFDIGVAGTTMVLFAPLFVGIAMAVRLTSRGPVMFRQQRVGRDGRCFELLKFRSMYDNDDSDTEWSVTDADRLTPVGSFLRRTSLDELPQVWNVFRGDMSLIGPRPERPFFVTEYSAEINGYDARHRLPVGLTGWAQVHGLRGDTSIDDRARFDNYYIDHWSVFLDLKILLYTAAETVRFAVSGEQRGPGHPGG